METVRLTSSLTKPRAEHFAALVLGCIGREYPYNPSHTINGPNDRRLPREMHPAFYGCFDWHSSVHGHWLLVRVLRRYPDSPSAPQIRCALAKHLTADNLEIETAYFEEPGRKGFERTYGWAWLLKLAQDLAEWDDEDARRWSAAVQPLAGLIERRYLDFLPRQTYPIRTGVHPNTAFGLAFALDYARALDRTELAALIRKRSRDYYGTDASAPAGWEPGGNEFFSPSLIEANLMRRVLPAAEFSHWLDRFLPNLRAGRPQSLLQPANVSDRADGQLVHLDGLNLSRAWCMWSIAAALPAADPRRTILLASAERHAEAGLTGVDSGEYMGDHWLATFAVAMLEAAETCYR
jgi:hypothetical protein